MPFRISLLEIHGAHACNLTCESCSHFSNSGHKGVVDLDEADTWMRNWNQRLKPALFRIVGGEPTLHPRLPQLIEMSARNWPDSQIGLTTNGFFLHRHPDMPAVLSKHNVILRLSIHHQSGEYQTKVREIISLITGWRQRYSFPVLLEKSNERWTRRHYGFGAGVLPFENANPKQSWENCVCKACMQLFRDRLWKCPPLTYLKLQKETYPEMSEKWDRYLEYDGIGSNCSDQELAEFLTRRAEAACGMCPADPQRFELPSPLISLGQLRRTAVAASLR